jgi:hypothetical protein
MANQHLATYLNDHLAGSVAALELLAQLEATHADTELARGVATLRLEIEEEQQTLTALMERLQITKSAPRQAVAWIAEKVTQLKLRLDDPADGALRLLQALEAIGVGIQGKRSLWRALAAAAVPGLPQADYARLVQRSEDQQQWVEAMRLQAAQVALGNLSLAEQRNES